MSATDLLIVAGEASGDLHGARLLSALRARAPEVQAFGMGGEELTAAGIDAIAASHEISVVGLTEVLKILPRARRIFAELLDEVDRRGARFALLIDSPDFNLRLAKKLHRRGIEVIYYISPQLWAWRKGRVKTVARYVDLMLVLFPFELDFYRRYEIDVRHVGHPLIDEVPRLDHIWDTGDPAPKLHVLALLPGSRVSEVRAILPIMRQVVECLAARAEISVRLIQASSVAPEIFDELLAGCPVEIERVHRRDRFPAIASSHLALCASGTATLEVALSGTPMLALYKVHAWSAFLGRLLLDVPYVSLVNLVLERQVVPEFLQERAEPESVAKKVVQLLADSDEIRSMRGSFDELRQRLGASGASGRAAEEVARRMGFEAAA